MDTMDCVGIIVVQAALCCLKNGYLRTAYTILRSQELGVRPLCGTHSYRRGSVEIIITESWRAAWRVCLRHPDSYLDSERGLVKIIMKIPIKKYIMDESLTWEDRYKKLVAHHAEETAWMIAEIKRLEAEVKDACEVGCGQCATCERINEQARKAQ